MESCTADDGRWLQSCIHPSCRSVESIGSLDLLYQWTNARNEVKERRGARHTHTYTHTRSSLENMPHGTQEQPVHFSQQGTNAKGRSRSQATARKTSHWSSLASVFCCNWGQGFYFPVLWRKLLMNLAVGCVFQALAKKGASASEKSGNPASPSLV
ncbi:hypothetical protein VTK73DRAFT_6923 [Phialemonium thermophilum]|uniref:Uncharacterized protein n=1 Tax=Phialemonium thermophilum TaxID=223376 RepID=A0ABR3WHC1_9PEZI